MDFYENFNANMHLHKNGTLKHKTLDRAEMYACVLFWSIIPLLQQFCQVTTTKSTVVSKPMKVMVTSNIILNNSVGGITKSCIIL